jgi:hypothetical protein
MVHITKSTPLPHPYDHNESKKDIFMSRGWGASGTSSSFLHYWAINIFFISGMPFSMFYLNQYMRQQDQQKQEAIRQQQQLRQQELNKMKIDNGGELKASRLIDDDGEKLRADNRMHNKNYSTIPQLFVSYGWGPMGTGTG